MEMLGGGKEVAKQCRLPDIMADAAYVILTRDSKNFTGNFVVDENILKEEGIKDFSRYLAVPGTPESDLVPDFFLDDLPEAPILAGSKPRFVDGKDTMADAAGASGSGAKTVQNVFDKLGSLVNEELVSKVNAVYTFKVKGLI